VNSTRIGLRLRVALAFTVAFTLMMCALGFTLFTAFEEMEDTLVERLMHDEVNFMVERLRQNPRLATPANPHLKAYLTRHAADEAVLPAYLRGLATGQHEVFEQGHEIHVAVRDVTDGRLYVAYDVSLFQQREQQFLVLLGLSILAVMMASLTLGYWLSGVLVRQITTLATTVDTLTPGELRQPLVQPGQEAEVAQLARAFDNYQARLDTVLRREQEFTANASHELRTPLTAIRTSCELLAADSGLTPKSAQRVASIATAAQRMSAEIDVLLLLAREQAAGETQPVAIADIVDDALDPYRDTLREKGLGLELEVAKDAVLTLNPRALQLVLSNLLRNAIQHTTQGHIGVRFHDGTLAVFDTGAGIAADRLQQIFERYYRGDGASPGGMGLGLSIVKRICDQFGWQVSAASVVNQGSTFTVRLLDKNSNKNK
jgi:signal transduction histidine kinase